MIGVFIGIGAILLGMKGFTPAGLPLTAKKRLAGRSARVVGVICIVVGIAFIADGVWSVYSITH
jgi:hypothetical protein